MADRLFTSVQTDEILSALRLETKLEKSTLARMAFILSLVKKGPDVPECLDYGGAQFNRPTFIGSDELFFRTIISSVHRTPDISEDNFYSNKSIIKNHIDNGSQLIHQLYIECGRDASKFLCKLVEQVDFEGRRELLGKGLDIFIGKEVLSKKDVVLELNNTQKHANSHLAIMGKPGVGKTQLLLKILADIRIQSNYQTHFIYFDYKGDVISKPHIIEVLRAIPYELMENQCSLPVNPFILPDYNDHTIHLSAREKAESFSSISSKLGIVQKGKLIDAIQSAYAKRAKSEKPYPDFQDVYEMASLIYDEERKNPDSLIEVLRDLAGFGLFWKHGDSNEPFERISNRSLIIGLNKMPVLKELVAYLVIERLYKEMVYLPDSPIQEGRRTIRTILVIDEAHNYLSQKNIFLQRIVREGRSKGIVVFFASQSPNDYQQDFFDFQELLEFALIFQCEGVTASSVQKILGCNNRTAKDLQTEIARLEPYQVVSRSADKTEDFIKFAAEPFYKNY
jgi:DNA sulfur modification protein DndE